VEPLKVEPQTVAPLSVAPQTVAFLGRTLVLVPHPDVETIGCGGLLALLGGVGAVVQVVLFTDGAGSHRQSRAYPRERLRALRQREMLAALRELGHGPRCLVSLGLPDGAVPLRGAPGFDTVVRRVAGITRCFRPDTVLMPARDDAHPDHRATCAVGAAACQVAAPGVRRLEYVVWGNPTASRTAWQVNIADVLAHKQRALALHRSQLGQVVLDDPQGFVLPPDLLARCNWPVETYFHASAGHADLDA
jgi:LmbE family N-acetylglucosaminyl deacetylase